MTEETRVCSKCGVEKPIHMFSMDRKKHRSCCKKCQSRYYNLYRNKNKPKLLKRNKIYYNQNRDKIRVQRKKYRDENRNIFLERDKKYRDENCDKIREYKNKPKSKIASSLRKRVRLAIKEQSGIKAYKSMELLGCSVDECRKWLEGKFLPGMTWDNYGQYGWHIDHIIPCASFDLTKPEEQLKCFHYTNLQPLWCEDNLSKNDKIQVLTSEGMFLV